jgi:hypothetical protein
VAETKPGITDVKLLFARSGNRCAFPKCTSPIAQGDTLIGEICHIKGAKPGSARNDISQTPGERHGYANLILLCPTHHTVIDDDYVTYTVERLHRMKANHESQVTPASDQQASRIADLFIQQGANIAAVAGGIAASVIHAQNFNVHAPPADTLLQSRRLQAVEKLWAILRRLNKEFSDLRYVHTILTADEMSNYFQTGWPSRFNIAHYADNQTVLQKMQRAGCDDADKERPFVSPRLWGAFFILRAVYGRLGYLCQHSFEEGRLVDWRTDSGIDQLLRSTLQAHVIEGVKHASFHGAADMIEHLEIQFMTASGMNPLEDSSNS